MQRVTEQVEATYFQQSPPRRLSATIMANLLSDYVFERPFKLFFDPVIIASIVVLILLFALRASTAIRLIPVLLIVIRLLLSARHLWLHVSVEGVTPLPPEARPAPSARSPMGRSTRKSFPCRCRREKARRCWSRVKRWSNCAKPHGATSESRPRTTPARRCRAARRRGRWRVLALLSMPR